MEVSLRTRAGDGTELAGTLRTPDGPPATMVALLLPGSGKVDRDADARRMPLGVSRRLADHLAANGIASYRYDKRGIGESGGEFLSTGLGQNLADATAAAALLRDVAERVVVIGHSEGAQHAIAMAGGAVPVDGAVLLSGAAATGHEVLRWQGVQIAATLPRPVRLILRLLRIDPTVSQAKQLARIADSTEDVVRVQGVRINAKWLREFLLFDPAPLLAAADVPLLAITGSADLQVDPADVARMEELAGGPFDGHVVDGVNHVLRAGPGAPTTYRRQTSDPLDPRVLDLVVDWLARLEAGTLVAPSAEQDAR